MLVRAGYNNTLYTLSMSANFRRRYITDFGRVEGVPGVYMANQLSLDLLHDSGNFHPVNYEKFLKSKVRRVLQVQSYIIPKVSDIKCGMDHEH